MSLSQSSIVLLNCFCFLMQHDLAAIGRQFEPYSVQGRDVMLWSWMPFPEQLWFE